MRDLIVRREFAPLNDDRARALYAGPVPFADAVGRLYAAFADVPRPTAIDYCPCCFTADQERALLAPVPLRELPAGILQPYAADVPFTVGGVDDFRYFAPRILDIACTVGFTWPDLESVAVRLRAAGWLSWPAGERDAIRGVLKALWAKTLAVFPSDPGVDVVLCAVGNAEDDLEPYLTGWARALGRPSAAEQLRDLLYHGCRSDGVRWRLLNAFWDGRDGQVGAWLAGAELRRAVTTAFATADSEDTLRVLVDLHDLVGG